MNHLTLLQSIGADQELLDYAKTKPDWRSFVQTCNNGAYLLMIAAAKMGEPGWPTDREVVRTALMLADRVSGIIGHKLYTQIVTGYKWCDMVVTDLDMAMCLDTALRHDYESGTMQHKAIDCIASAFYIYHQEQPAYYAFDCVENYAEAMSLQKGSVWSMQRQDYLDALREAAELVRANIRFPEILTNYKKVA